MSGTGRFEVWNFGGSQYIPPFRGGEGINLLQDSAIYTDDEELAKYLSTFDRVDMRELEKAERPEKAESLADLPMGQLHKLANKYREKKENFFGKTKAALREIIENRREPAQKP